MKIERARNRLGIHFDNTRIKTLEYDSEGRVCVYGRHDKLISTFKTCATVAFNGQYGTPISEDGRFIFIGNWDRGLFCYSTDSGETVWQQGPGKVRRILVIDNELIVEMADRGIYKRKTADGSLSFQLKMGSISTFTRINKDTLFTGPKRNVYFTYNIPSMEPNGEVHEREINVNDCLSFVIQDVFYRNTKLMAQGFENYEKRNYSNNNRQDFLREVRVSAV